MSDSSIRFGIVIPFYGVEKYIRRCLDSVVNQTYKNFVAVLVDDESKDGSRAIAESYQKKYPDMFMIIAEENQGQGEARNNGFKHLSEDVDYFIFLDSDDYIDKTLLEKANSIVEKEQYDIVVYNFCEIDENGHVFGTYNFCEDETGSVSMQDIRKHMRFTSVVPGRIYNRQFWRETGAEFPKRLWYEDTAIASYVFSRCKKMYLLNETLYYYIQREGSTMNNQKLEKMMDIIKSLNYLHSLFIRTDSYEEYKNEIEATSALGIIVIINRLNMLEKGDRLQTQLSDYLFDRFPNCFENSLLDE
jgi:glycosyltransferase involved in cell wall biosynthesis